MYSRSTLNGMAKLTPMRYLALPLALFMASDARSAGSRLDCYIAVHEGCFNDGQTPCTPQDYEFWLNSCDAQTPGDSANRRSYNVQAPSQEAANSSTYKKKMSRIKAKISKK